MMNRATGCGLVLLWIVAGAGCAQADRDGSPAWVPSALAHGDKHEVYVDSMADFLAYAGEADTRIYVAAQSKDPGGDYVFEACPPGIDERTDPGCGMVVLGPGTEVIGSGRNQILDGVPTGKRLTKGPLFDCGALLCRPASGDGPCGPDDWGPDDFNGWDLGCFEMSGGNLIRGVRIDNGPDAVGQNPGEGVHRNAVLVQPGEGAATLEHNWFTDVRRGALVVAGEDRKTTFRAYGNVTYRTELANFFLILTEAPPRAIDDAEMDAVIASNYMDDIGRVSMIHAWGVGGRRGVSDAVFIDNVIGPNTNLGLFVFAEGFLTPEPVVDHRATTVVQGGRIASQGLGFTVFVFDDGPRPQAHGNALDVTIDGVTFANSGLPIYAEYDPWGPKNRYRLTLSDVTYEGDAPGVVDACAFSYDTFSCTDPGDDPPFQFVGSRAELADVNRNLDFVADDAFFTD